jgi:hypothetical protein
MKLVLVLAFCWVLAPVLVLLIFRILGTRNSRRP